MRRGDAWVLREAVIGGGAREDWEGLASRSCAWQVRRGDRIGPVAPLAVSLEDGQHVAVERGSRRNTSCAGFPGNEEDGGCE